MHIQICDSEFDHISLYKADLPSPPNGNGNNGVTFQTRQSATFEASWFLLFRRE
jgi:hypothetical protein